ncbi:MAG: hypothetical protein ACXWC6_08755 [Ramlibacter sp.]
MPGPTFHLAQDCAAIGPRGSVVVPAGDYLVLGDQPGYLSVTLSGGGRSFILAKPSWEFLKSAGKALPLRGR